jgi:putative membrane protein
MTAENTDEKMLSSTDLAFMRTILAENRTLMAWIRTAISLISFGFTIYKFFEETIKTATGSERIVTPRIAGMILIVFGLLSLLWGLSEYNSGFKLLKKGYPEAEKSRTSLLGILILLFGLALFLAALFRE